MSSSVPVPALNATATFDLTVLGGGSLHFVLSVGYGVDPCLLHLQVAPLLASLARHELQIAMSSRIVYWLYEKWSRFFNAFKSLFHRYAIGTPSSFLRLRFDAPRALLPYLAFLMLSSHYSIGTPSVHPRRVREYGSMLGPSHVYS